MKHLSFILIAILLMSVANAKDEGTCGANLTEGMNAEKWQFGLARAFLLDKSNEIDTIEHKYGESAKVNYFSILQVELIDQEAVKQNGLTTSNICDIKASSLNKTFVIKYYLESREDGFYISDKKYHSPFSQELDVRAYFVFNEEIELRNKRINTTSSVLLDQGSLQTHQYRFTNDGTTSDYFNLRIKNLEGFDSLKEKTVLLECASKLIGVRLCKKQ